MKGSSTKNLRTREGGSGGRMRRESELLALWRGSAPRDDRNGGVATDQPIFGRTSFLSESAAAAAASETERVGPKATIVVMHCDKDLGWLREYASGINVRRLVVASKCGVDPQVDGASIDAEASELLPGVDLATELVRLPNVGRCDHSMAHYMERVASASGGGGALDDDGSDVVVFLKDSLDVQRADGKHDDTRDLKEAIRIATRNGFGCLRAPLEDLSSLHATEVLTEFKIDKYDGLYEGKKNVGDGFESRHESMGAWLDELGLTLPTPVTPVCYGGMFAVATDRIRSFPADKFAAIRDSLTRGDNVEEGHFAERAWAGLLSDAPDPGLAAQATRFANYVFLAWGGQFGALARDYASSRLLAWDWLPAKVQETASVLGYVADTWDEERDSLMAELRGRTELSPDEKEAVVALGLEDEFLHWSDGELDSLLEKRYGEYVSFFDTDAERLARVDKKHRPGLDRAIAEIESTGITGSMPAGFARSSGGGGGRAAISASSSSSGPSAVLLIFLAIASMLAAFAIAYSSRSGRREVLRRGRNWRRRIVRSGALAGGSRALKAMRRRSVQLLQKRTGGFVAQQRTTKLSTQ